MTTSMTPEDYRRRYDELKQQAAEANAQGGGGRATVNPAALSYDLVAMEETIPADWYATFRLARGQSLRILNDHATPGVSALLWNAHDPSERYNAGDTVKVQWTARITVGRLLLSDMGRVLASVTADTCGFNDSIAGGSTRASNMRKYGAEAVHRRNSRDNFILAAGKLGLGPRDVGPCITFFAPVIVDEAGRFVWRENAIKPGDYVDLRAETDLLVALSNAPHPLSPSHVPAMPIRAAIWHSPRAEADDLCRIGTAEARRAFENTDALIGEAS